MLGVVLLALASCKEKRREPARDSDRSYEYEQERHSAAAARAQRADEAAKIAEEAVQAAREARDLLARPPPSARDVPSERGVPLDQTALGSLPHPFGALEVIEPTSTREDILSALPNARRAGTDRLTVPLGVEDLVGVIEIDYSGHFDVVNIALPSSARELLAKAWGPPTASGAWFDHKKRWRADLDRDNQLTIGPFKPLADLLGKGPDGLAEAKGILGATHAELTERFGARVREIGGRAINGKAPRERRLELLMPATEVCRYFTHAEAELAGDRVAKLHLFQCYDDESSRRAALVAIERRWGKAVPIRTAEDLPAFSFRVPARNVTMALDENSDGDAVWLITIVK